MTDLFPLLVKAMVRRGIRKAYVLEDLLCEALVADEVEFETLREILLLCDEADARLYTAIIYLFKDAGYDVSHNWDLRDAMKPLTGLGRAGCLLLEIAPDDTTWSATSDDPAVLASAVEKVVPLLDGAPAVYRKVVDVTRSMIRAMDQ